MRCKLTASFSKLQNSLAGGDDDLIASSHAALLNKLDAIQTMLQKEQGDPADILQMVLWQERLCSTARRLTSLRPPSTWLHDHPGLDAGTYSDMIRELGRAFHETAEALECEKVHLEPLVREMEHRLEELEPREKAHREFLLVLQVLCHDASGRHN